MLPCGTYFETYNQAKAIVHTRLQWIILILFLLLLSIFPFIAGPSVTAVAIIMCITLIAVLGLQIVTGYCGQINLGQAAFMGVGAYACGFFAGNLGLPFWVAVPVSGISAALIGVLFGLPAAQIKGFYLALTTLAAQFIFTFVMVRLPVAWFGGYGGIEIPILSLLGLDFDTDQEFYYVVMTTAIASVLIAVNITRSRLGRAFMAIRDDESAAEIMGIRVNRHKIVAFSISAFFAGIAGALWGYYTRHVGIEQFTLWQSLWYLGMIIVGGLGSVTGAVFGVILIKGLQEMINVLGPALSVTFPGLAFAGGWFALMNLFLGGLIILFVTFWPKGLNHTWKTFKLFYRKWPFSY